MKFSMPRNDAYDEVVESLKSRALVSSVPQTTLSGLQSTFETHAARLKSEIFLYGELQQVSEPQERNDLETLRKLSAAASNDNTSEQNAENAIWASTFNPRALKTRHLEDPRSAKCDAVGVLRIPGFFWDFGNGTTQKYFKDLHRFGILPHPKLPKKKEAEASVSTNADGIRSVDLGRETNIEESRDVFASVRRASRCNRKGASFDARFCTKACLMPYQGFFSRLVILKNLPRALINSRRENGR